MRALLFMLLLPMLFNSKCNGNQQERTKVVNNLQESMTVLVDIYSAYRRELRVPSHYKGKRELYQMVLSYFQAFLPDMKTKDDFYRVFAETDTNGDNEVSRDEYFNFLKNLLMSMKISL